MATRKEKAKGYDTLSTGHPNIPDNCKAFCEVCGHGVYNMEKHIQTEDHKRNLRRDPLRALYDKGGEFSASQGFRSN